MPSMRPPRPCDRGNSKPSTAAPRSSRRSTGNWSPAASSHRSLPHRGSRGHAGMAPGHRGRARARDRGVWHHAFCLPCAAPLPNPERLRAWMAREWPGVIRSKGFFLAGHPLLTTWASGRVPGHNPMCAWQAAGLPPCPATNGPTIPKSAPWSRATGREPNGDRRQEIVVIGLCRQDGRSGRARGLRRLSPHRCRDGRRTRLPADGPCPTRSPLWPVA